MNTHEIDARLREIHESLSRDAARLRWLFLDDRTDAINAAWRAADQAADLAFWAAYELRHGERPAESTPDPGDVSPRINADLARELLEPVRPPEGDTHDPESVPISVGSPDRSPLDRLPIAPAPGTKLFGCNRCNALRTRDFPVCHCGCPEYRLLVVAESREAVRDEEARAELAAKPAKPRRARKAKAAPGPEPLREESPLVESTASSATIQDWRSANVHLLDLDGWLRDRLARSFENIGLLADAVDRIGDEAPGYDHRGLEGLGRNSLAQIRGALAHRLVFPVKQEDPGLDSRTARRLWPNSADLPRGHGYLVDLEDGGDGYPTTLGTIEAASLAEAIRLAPERFAADVQPGTPLVVTPGKGFLDGRWVEVRECVACGKRWPAGEGVGCPDCLHGPAVEPEPAELLHQNVEQSPVVDLDAPETTEPVAPTTQWGVDLTDGCRVFYRDNAGREWPGVYRFTLGQLASVVLDHAPGLVALNLRVDPSTLRVDPRAAAPSFVLEVAR